MSNSLPQTALEAVEGRDLDGRIFLVTGGYSGLGASMTRALLTGGATVVVAGRSARKQAAFAGELVEEGFDAERIDAADTLDLGDLASVRAFSDAMRERYERIDVLVANAGVMNTPAGTTADGFEVQMGTNVIGHFLLARRLVAITKRQVWLSSRAHLLIGDPPGADKFDVARAPRIDLDAIETVDASAYDGWHRYQQSKLGDLLLAKQFAVEFDRLRTCAVHPGAVRTNLSRHMSVWTILKYVWSSLTGGGSRILTPDQGAATQTWCAVVPEDELVDGAYYVDCAIAPEAEAAKNADDAKALYDYCDRVSAEFQ